MAPKTGLGGSVVYMTGGTTLVAKVREWSLDFSNNLVDVTAFTDEWEDVRPGIRGYSGSFSMIADTDGSHGTIRAAALAGSAVSLRLYDSSTTYYNIGTAYIEGSSPSVSYDGAAEDSYSFKGSGALTFV